MLSKKKIFFHFQEDIWKHIFCTAYVYTHYVIIFVICWKPQTDCFQMFSSYCQVKIETCNSAPTFSIKSCYQAKLCWLPTNFFWFNQPHFSGIYQYRCPTVCLKLTNQAKFITRRHFSFYINVIYSSLSNISRHLRIDLAKKLKKAQKKTSYYKI